MLHVLRKLMCAGLFMAIMGMAAVSPCYDTGANTQTYCLSENRSNTDWAGLGFHEYFTGPPRCSVGLTTYGEQQELSATIGGPSTAPQNYAYVSAYDALSAHRGQTSALFSAIYGNEIRAYPTMLYPMGASGASPGTFQDQIYTDVPLTSAYGSGTASALAFIPYYLSNNASIVFKPPSVDVNQAFEARVYVNPHAWPNPTYRWTSANGAISPTPSLLQRSFSTGGWRTFTVVIRSPSRSDSLIITKSMNVIAPCSGGSTC